MKSKISSLSKRFLAIILTCFMGVSLFSQTAFATENDSIVNNESPDILVASSGEIPEDAVAHTYEITVEPSETLTGKDISSAISRSYYPQETFTFGGARRGSDHYLDGNYMAYEVRSTMDDGSTNNSVQVLIQVRKYSGTQVVDGWRTFYPDGATHKADWIYFPGGGTCYFNYFVTNNSTTKSVTLSLTVYSWA